MKRASMGLGALVVASGLSFAPGAFAQDPPAEEAPADEAAAEEEAADAPAKPPADPAKPPPDGEQDEEQAAPPPPPVDAPPTGAAAPATPPSAAPAAGGFSFGGSAGAQADTGASDEESADGKPRPLPWRGTALAWDHSVTAQTLGVGQQYQSRNPTYEMSFSLQPRYYLWETEEADQSISLRARLDLIREFTNSDTTTRQGEWTFSDLSLFPQYGRNLYKDGAVTTDLGVRVPTLQFPTSKVSANNGRIFAAGAQVFVTQGFPVLGEESDVLQQAGLTARVGYNHWFTDATQPTNNELGRVRMGPDGGSIAGDQLGGAAFAQHQANIDFLADLKIADRVRFGMTFSWRPVWKYEFENVDVCNNVITGCVTPETVDDPNNFSVITLFGAEVSVDPIDEMAVALGYANLTLQAGPDGTRRNIFYSPDARVYLTLTAKLDKIYETASGRNQRGTAGTTPVRTMAAR